MGLLIWRATTAAPTRLRPLNPVLLNGVRHPAAALVPPVLGSARLVGRTCDDAPAGKPNQPALVSGSSPPEYIGERRPSRK